MRKGDMLDAGMEMARMGNDVQKFAIIGELMFFHFNSDFHFQDLI